MRSLLDSCVSCDAGSLYRLPLGGANRERPLVEGRPDLLTSYLPLLVYVALALLVPTIISSAPYFLGPKKPSRTKLMAYESGYPTQPLLGRFPVKFYLVAMLFVIFDVEAASFYPWAVNLSGLKVFGLWEMLSFIIVLGIGYAYVWKKGGFSWR